MAAVSFAEKVHGFKNFKSQSEAQFRKFVLSINILCS